MIGRAGAEAPGAGAAEGALEAFERERGRLFGVAYRMLGSAREAEDVLQDAWMRWQGVDHTGVQNPAAYLVRLVTRLCIDALRTARARRTEYVGVWLPEPLVGEVDDGPAALQELADDLSLAFLFMLERLNPVERAVFLLRESFDFSFREIAGVVGKSEENCRQIDRRARRRLAGEGRAPANPAEHDRLLLRFLGAVREGDLQGLLDVLADDAVAYSDGGGRVTAARRPVASADHVARFIIGLVRKAPPGWEARLVTVNGRKGVANYLDGKLFSLMTIHVEDGRIRNVFTVLNPDKLPEGRDR